MERLIRRTLGVLFAVAMVFSYNLISHADESGAKISYQAHFYDRGYVEAGENTELSRSGSYITALKFTVKDQEAGMSGTVQYEVNLSGSGWLTQVENMAEAGDSSGAMPIEAVRVRLNGQLAQNYDVYTKVLTSSGAWSDWVKNGETAGVPGEGKRVDGIRVAITKKDSGVPSEENKKINNGAIGGAAIRDLDSTKPMIALTWDDGPVAANTNRIVANLNAVGGRGTFFVVGKSIRGANLEAMRAAAASGHEIGNHTYAHANITKQSEAARIEAIESTNKLIQDATGVRPVVFRPPYGAYNNASLDTLRNLGMASIFWSVDTLDWKYKNVNHVVNHVLSHAKDGDIILMHDLHSTTAVASDTIIRELSNRGYQLVTVSELAAYRGGLKPGANYSAFRR